MFESSVLALVLLGLALGLRHGIDWDHIAAIADITGSVAATDEAQAAAVGVEARGLLRQAQDERQEGQDERQAARPVHVRFRAGQAEEARHGFLLAMLYAIGHATVVALLGFLAIWASSLLPEWIDPIMERVVGATLLLLGAWIFYSFWRYGRSVRLRSRWMLAFSLMGSAWEKLASTVTGRPGNRPIQIEQYGPKTAFAVGMIHGIGAETGSQALLLATAAGATTSQHGSLMLLSFVVGLIVANSAVAALSAFGFASAHLRRNAYFLVGLVAGVFSLVVGFAFIMGQSASLPDLAALLGLLAGPGEM